MRVRKLNENGDIATSGNIWLYDREAVAQTIKTRLKMFYGEYFRDVLDGTPWFQEVIGNQSTQSRIDSLLRNRIARTTGVDRLLEFNTTYVAETRELHIKCTVLTQWGAVEIQTGEGING